MVLLFLSSNIKEKEVILVKNTQIERADDKKDKEE